MRSRLVPLVLALSLIGLVALTTSPAPAATSVYEMGGGGTLEALDAGGMPACVRFTEYGGMGDNVQSQNCNSAKMTSWKFGTLPILSGGVLFGKPQAATYGCGNSEVKTVGGTDNFQVDFSFNCDLQAGTGWGKITGFFSSDPDGAPSGLYGPETAGTGCTGPCGLGRPYWEGEFRASNSDGTGAVGPVPMKCSGMFEPTGFGTFGGTSVTDVLFEGECTAVSP